MTSQPRGMQCSRSQQDPKIRVKHSRHHGHVVSNGLLCSIITNLQLLARARQTKVHRVPCLTRSFKNGGLKSTCLTTGRFVPELSVTYPKGTHLCNSALRSADLHTGATAQLAALLVRCQKPPMHLRYTRSVQLRPCL